MKKYTLAIILSVFTFIGSSCTANTVDTATRVESAQQKIEITSSEFRFGRAGEEPVYLTGSYESRDQIQIKNPREIKSEYTEPLRVEAREHVEVVVAYTDVPLKKNDLFKQYSEFYIIDSEGKRQPVTHAGGGASWIIEGGVAKAVIAPHVHVPYNADGEMELVLRLEGEDGVVAEQKWKFQVDNSSYRK